MLTTRTAVNCRWAKRYAKKMKIELQEDIRDIFSIFHDGGISCAKSKAHGLVLEIEIQYLAERV